MNNLSQLRIAAKEIFDNALAAVNVEDAVRRVIKLRGSEFSIGDTPIDATRIYAVAVGKAAFSMSEALEQSLGQVFNGGVAVGPSPNLAQAEWLSKSRWNWYVGGHPLPNHESLSAAADAVGLLQRANKERAPIIFLISGGGSAMMEWPAAANITLKHLQAANQVLVNCGASISEINAVRRALSAVKGGKLAARAADCDQITLIVSDVPPDEEYNVASGPTMSPGANAHSAPAVIAHYDLRSQLPAEIVHAVDNSREFHVQPSALRRQIVLLRNGDALRAAAAAAKQRGFISEIQDDIADQSIGEGCAQLIKQLQDADGDRERPRCLISGGEFACAVNGDGVGGRNLETALRLAILNQSSPVDFVAVCAGTDGIDGNSPAAGAFVDSTTIERAQALGLNAEDFLGRSDAYSFFSALGDVITTGPTGTNVRDLRIIIRA